MIQIGLAQAYFNARRRLDSSRVTLVSIVSIRCAQGTGVNGGEDLIEVVADIISERGVDAHSDLWQLVHSHPVPERFC